MISLDRAYCKQTGCVLTVYQVRDLHFDDDNEFNARSAQYECPDEECNAALVGVNHSKAEFKNTPHFRLLTGHKHLDACDYDGNSDKRNIDEPKEKGTERSHKVSEHPEVLLLERQPLPFGTGKSGKKKKTATQGAILDISNFNSSGNDDKASPHETSCLEHIVETWVSNDAEDLQHSSLTIGDKTKWYRNAFKPIKYFYQEKGLIYWGNIKSIKKYTSKSKTGSDYAITFSDRPYFEDESRQISLYIPNELIEKYRKRKLFRRYIDSLVGSAEGSVNGYFVGTYPQLKDEEVVTSKGNFRPLEVHLTNLDHLVLRFDKDGEDL